MSFLKAGSKGVVTVDLFPSTSSFGVTGLIIFFVCLIISIIIYIRTGNIWMFILLQFLFVAGFYVGRIYESKYHKHVMGHMSPEFQKLYKKVERAIVDSEVEGAKVSMMEKKEDEGNISN